MVGNLRDQYHFSHGNKLVNRALI